MRWRLRVDWACSRLRFFTSSARSSAESGRGFRPRFFFSTTRAWSGEPEAVLNASSSQLCSETLRCSGVDEEAVAEVADDFGELAARRLEAGGEARNKSLQTSLGGAVEAQRWLARAAVVALVAHCGDE